MKSVVPVVFMGKDKLRIRQLFSYLRDAYRFLKLKIYMAYDTKNIRVYMAEKTGKQRVDFNELKSGGFIKQTQKDLFTVR